MDRQFPACFRLACLGCDTHLQAGNAVIRRPRPGSPASRCEQPRLLELRCATAAQSWSKVGIQRRRPRPLIFAREVDRSANGPTTCNVVSHASSSYDFPRTPRRMVCRTEGHAWCLRGWTEYLRSPTCPSERLPKFGLEDRSRRQNGQTSQSEPTLRPSSVEPVWRGLQDAGDVY